MTDLASLGLRIESQQADKASAAMDKMAASADRAERSADKLGAGSTKADGAIAGLLASIDRTTKEMLELSRLHQQAGGAALVHAGATEKLTNEITQASTAHMFFGASFKAAQTDMGGAAAAVRSYERDVESLNRDLSGGLAPLTKWRDAMIQGTREIGQADSHMALYRANIGKVGTGLQLTAQDGLNFSRQMADIGVTAAMGMNPLMIILQQGPQLFEILQTTAIRSSMSIRATMAATGTVIWTALAPILPIVGAIALAAGTVALSWGLATRAITKEIGDVGKEMSLTEEQLERLKEANISTTATAGDAWRGLGTTIGDVLKETFGAQVAWAAKQWNSFLDDLTKNTGAEVDAIAGFFVGSYRAVVATWKTFPAVFSDVVAMAANAGASILNDFLKNSVKELNFIIRQLNTIHRLTGGVGVVANEIAAPGAAFRTDRATSGAAANVGAEYAAGFASMRGASGRFMDTWRQNTRDSAEARIRAGAGDGDASGAGRAAREAAKLREVLDPLPRIDLQPLRVQFIELVEPLQLVADEMRLIDQLAQDSARGMASAFGETGRVLGDLLTNMTGFESRMAEIALAERKKQLSGSQADRERAHAQVQYYGDMLGAAKGFFQEGSDGYRALQAAEAAWRVFSFAMSVQAMAQQAAETSASVAGSAAKGTASAAAGAAKMFEALGPFGFPVVAAMIALLASLGLKGKGGGGGSASPSLDGSVAKSQGYSQQADTTQSSFAASLAQKVEVRVTADRDGLNAYVAQTAREEATPLVMQGMAAASGATRAQVMSDLDKGRTYSRG